MSGFNKSRVVVLAGCADFGVFGFDTGSLISAFLAGLTSGREIGFFCGFGMLGRFAGAAITTFSGADTGFAIGFF